MKQDSAEPKGRGLRPLPQLFKKVVQKQFRVNKVVSFVPAQAALRQGVARVVYKEFGGLAPPHGIIFKPALSCQAQQITWICLACAPAAAIRCVTIVAMGFASGYSHRQHLTVNKGHGGLQQLRHPRRHTTSSAFACQHAVHALCKLCGICASRLTCADGSTPICTYGGQRGTTFHGMLQPLWHKAAFLLYRCYNVKINCQFGDLTANLSVLCRCLTKKSIFV